MRIALLAATALVTVSPLSLTFAQNQLPPTTVTAPKRVATPVSLPADNKVPGIPQLSGDVVKPLPLYADPSTPKVKSTDWNAPGVYNLHYMTDVQFAEFKRIHPTAVMPNRCYIGQDPDISIRNHMEGPQGRSGIACLGGGG